MEFSLDYAAVLNALDDAMEGVAESALRTHRAGLNEHRRRYWQTVQFRPGEDLSQTDGDRGWPPSTSFQGS